MRTEKHILVKKYLQMGLTWIFHNKSEKKDQEVETQRLSRKEKVPIVAISKEGYVRFHHNWFPNQNYYLNDTHRCRK